MGVVEINVCYREAGDCLVEGDGDGDQSVVTGRDGVGCNDNGGAGRLGVDTEVAAGAGAHPGVALRVLDAAEVHADGVLGALAPGLGHVAGGPDPAVGADRRQRAQRAFAGVVLNVVEIKAGDALAEGEGDGGAFASGEAVVADRHRDLGRLGVDDDGGGVIDHVGAVAGVADAVRYAVQIHCEPLKADAIQVGRGCEGGSPDSDVVRVLRQVAHRTVGDLNGGCGEATDDLVEGDGDGGGFAGDEALFVERNAGGNGILGVDHVVVAGGADRCGVVCGVTDGIEEAQADGVGGVLGVGRSRVGDGVGAAVGGSVQISYRVDAIARDMGVVEINVCYREAGDCLVEGDGDGDQSVVTGRDGVGCNDNGGAGRLVVEVVGDEVDVARARVAREIGDAGHVDADLEALRVGVCRQVGRRPQVYLPRPAVVGGAQVLQRAHARRYRQVSRGEAGLIQLLVEDEADGGDLVGAGQVGVADRRCARERGRPGVDDEDGAGGVVGGAGRVVADAALGSVQVRGRREGGLIGPGGGGEEGIDVSEAVVGG